MVNVYGAAAILSLITAVLSGIVAGGSHGVLGYCVGGFFGVGAGVGIALLVFWLEPKIYGLEKRLRPAGLLVHFILLPIAAVACAASLPVLSVALLFTK